VKVGLDLELGLRLELAEITFKNVFGQTSIRVSVLDPLKTVYGHFSEK